MSGTRADARKAREETPVQKMEREAREATPAAMLREADRLALEGKVLAALRRVYFGAEWCEANALIDALADEGVEVSG